VAAYLSVGQLSPYRIPDPDYPAGILMMGGSAFGALEGMRLYTEDCAPVAYAGCDYEDIFEEWLLRHALSQRMVATLSDPCPRLEPNGDGTYAYSQNPDRFEPDIALIEPAVNFDTRGLSIAAQATNTGLWFDLYELRCRFGFRLMWEYTEYMPSDRVDRAELYRILSYLDMWSLRVDQASRLFDLPLAPMDALLGYLQTLPVAVTFLFDREKGSYVITPKEVVFCEAVDFADSVGDHNGSDSVSAGAALYAYCEGYAPGMIAAMANTAAGYHAVQSGPIDQIAGYTMREAHEKAYALYRKTTGSR